VKFVASRLQREVNNAAGRTSELRRVSAGGQREFLERIWAGRGLCESSSVFSTVSRGAIDEDVGAPLTVRRLL
jgi:hypothetical protein